MGPSLISVPAMRLPGSPARDLQLDSERRFGAFALDGIVFRTSIAAQRIDISSR